MLDPMLATGGSAVDAIAQIKKRGPKNIKFMCIIAAPEGLEALQAAHPDVQVYCASLDEHLNDHGYIVPGLGDAGDRIFRNQIKRRPARNPAPVSFIKIKTTNWRVQRGASLALLCLLSPRGERGG